MNEETRLIDVIRNFANPVMALEIAVGMILEVLSV